MLCVPNAGKADVYTKIKHLIICDEFSPGRQISISALQDKLSVSSTPIREALARLHAESLIDIVPHRGYFIRALDLEEWMQLHAFALLGLEYSLAQGACGDTAELRNRFSAYAPPMNVTPDAASAPQHRTDFFEGAACEIEQLYHDVATISGNRPVLAAIRNFSDRTHFLRVVDLRINSAAIQPAFSLLVSDLAAGKLADAARDLREMWRGFTERASDVMKEGLLRIHRHEKHDAPARAWLRETSMMSGNPSAWD